ncbi:MAG: hypothetical protein CBB95_15475 [Alteromonas sp. TMED35]|mgnify:CR=1 FL=1|nr:MAG: hypothetical protein CBB95_15475 [Alteromonas sp. TMED35]|tara:strand:+ start:4264 stop:4494 length:231 start_codon:yes stop_codon:yes gene_type:complete
MKQLDAVGMVCPGLFMVIKMFIQTLDMGEKAHIVTTAPEAEDRLNRLKEAYKLEVVYHKVKAQHHFLVTKGIEVAE